MPVFRDGKEAGGQGGAVGIDDAIVAAISKAGDGLVARIISAIGARGLAREAREEDDAETMAALAKVASTGSKVDGSNFSRLGKEESVAPGKDMDEAIGAIGEVE